MVPNKVVFAFYFSIMLRYAYGDLENRVHLI